MGEEDPPADVAAAPPPPAAEPVPKLETFDPSRMIGIIRRKALIKDLAAVYHAECLKYCRELLELQKKWDEPYTEMVTPEEPRKEVIRRPKRAKKAR
ncbi:hypothetical protein H6P81_019524 [Aristolochia fimbriata]|uniref:Uncharacterized protein n=1 Tax=Aristolochia fimbriata TaxID=158543 RepID=A0AAV7DTN8_ARIFI|nr:hypothetical protein H6P81_019524 [Aristolochia fimbriata]